MTVRTVLFVDDDAGLLELASLTLDTERGLRVRTMRDARLALEAARREKPDIIFLDLKMPSVSGAELCKLIKSDPSTSAMKVVILSAMRSEEVAESARNAGADGFLTKPFSPRRLVELVNDLLARPTGHPV